jgi:TATA-binding related factor (TRF) of subunit 20 of Mediator complex
MAVISVPTGPPTEELFWTIAHKMEPLWAFRSSLRLENGAAFSLLGGDWRLRLGDARITAGQGQSRVRGLVAEVEFCDVAEDGVLNGVSKEAEDGKYVIDWEGRETMLRSFWDGLVRESGVSMDRLQVVVKVPGAAKGERDDLTLVRQYMELLRFTRA